MGVAVRRDTGEKKTMRRSTLPEMPNMLDTIQSDMFNRAKKQLDEHVTVADDWQGFVSALDKSHLIMAPFCGAEACEDSIKEDSKGHQERRIRRRPQRHGREEDD